MLHADQERENMPQASKQKGFQSRLDQAISQLQSGLPDSGQTNSCNGYWQCAPTDTGDAPRGPVASAFAPDQPDPSPSTFDPGVLTQSEEANAAIQQAVATANSQDQLDEKADMPPPSVVTEATQDLERLASGSDEGDPSLGGTATATSIFPPDQSDPVPVDSPLRAASEGIKELDDR